MPEQPDHVHELDRFWNDLLRGQLDAAGYAVDPSMMDAVHAFHALARPPAPATRIRVDQAVLSAIAQSAPEMAPQPLRPLALPTLPLSANGAGKPVALGIAQPAPRWRWQWQPGLFASMLATALILLVLLGGFAARSAHLRWPTARPVIMPALESDPARSGVAPPVVEEAWETQGGPNTPLFLPFGVAVAPDGRIWVADGSRGQFQIFAPDGAFSEAWGAPGSGNGQFSFKGSGDVAFDAAGNIYVADAGNFRIQKFGPDREFLTAWGMQGSGPGQFLSPMFITIGPDGDMYVSDDKRNQILRFDAAGHFLNAIGEPGSGDGQLNAPGGVAIDHDGTVWVSDYNNNRIALFSPEGQFLRTWGTAGNRAGELNLPNDLAFDAQGLIYVLESGNNRVQVFDRDFRTVTMFGREDLSAEAGLNNADPARQAWFTFLAAMAIDPQGHIYVSDTMGNLVAAFRVLPPGSAATTADATPDTLAISANDAVLMQGMVDTMPNKELWLGIEQVTLAPGAEWTIDDGDGIGPLLYRVESGQLTVTPNGESTLTRAGSAQPQALPAASTVTLGVGDQAFHPSGVAPRWRNAGQEPVAFLEARVVTIGNSVPPQGSTRYPLVTGSAFPPLATPCVFTLHRLTLPPHTTFSTDTTPGLTLLYIESGQLEAHDAPSPAGSGASPATPPASFMIINGVDAVRTFPPGRVYEAVGSAPASVLLVTLTAPNPLEETPMR